jgi:hypothetical protein
MYEFQIDPVFVGRDYMAKAKWPVRTGKTCILGSYIGAQDHGN